MKNGSAEDFLDTLYVDNACVRSHSYVYRFSRVRYNAERGLYSIDVEKYRYTEEPFSDFIEIVYYYESDDEEDCLNHIAEDVLWDGKSFYELEKALTWIDW
jgi:hypothetical protein